MPREPKEEMPPHVRKHVELLKNSNWYVRVAAAEQLGGFGHPGAVPYLARSLRDEDAEVKMASVDALWKILHPSAIPHLVGVIRLNTSGPEMKEHAAKALKTIGRAIQGKEVERKGAKALQLVAPHLREEDEPELVLKAFRAALRGKITKANARLYVKQLRALQGKLK